MAAMSFSIPSCNCMPPEPASSPQNSSLETLAALSTAIQLFARSSATATITRDFDMSANCRSDTSSSRCCAFQIAYIS
jgi:hypothetical protein